MNIFTRRHFLQSAGAACTLAGLPAWAAGWAGSTSVGIAASATSATWAMES